VCRLWMRGADPTGRPPTRLEGLAPPTPEPRGHRWRSARRVFGVAAGNRPPRAGITAATRQSCRGTQVREPRPGHDTCAGTPHRLTRGRKGVETQRRAGLQLAMPQNRTGAVQATDGQGAGLQVEAPGHVVWCRGAALAVASAGACGR